MIAPKEFITQDYKKWLLYSFDNQHPETYYDLFKALKGKQDSGTVKITMSENSDITISADNVSDDLQITEDQRTALIKYLIDNYFHSEEVDKVMLEKRQRSEIAVNHNFLKSKNHSFTDQPTSYKVQAHPKESIYFNIKLVVSLLFYALIIGYFVYGALTDLSSLLMLFVILSAVLVAGLLNTIVMGIFVGIIRGNSIRVTPEQYPDIYTIIKEQAIRLKIKELPEIYITAGHFNAFVTKLARKHVLMLYSEVVETALSGNYEVLKYVTAHELCHIKQSHLTKEKYLLPSRIIPFLGLAYSRGCEYTCDRAGYDFSPKGSIEGVLIMTTGKEIHSKFNIELHIKNAMENEGFWTWLSEKFLTHPHLYKRLVQIKNYSKYN
jgi:Zn-dependent protease with chaperone function